MSLAVSNGTTNDAAEEPLSTTPDLKTLYAAVAGTDGRWQLVIVRRDHGANYEQVVRYFSDTGRPVRIFNARGIMCAGLAVTTALGSAKSAQGVTYVGKIDPLFDRGRNL